MYQSYDFKKEVDNHIDRKIPIKLEEKSKNFKKYLFQLKIFQLEKRITKSHELFGEEYFMFIKSNAVFVAKKIAKERFEHIEIIDGLKVIRKMKLKQLFT